VTYRDDRQALALEIAELERENHRLREQLEDAERKYTDAVEEGHQTRARGSRHNCVMCGGSLLPVAVFAGHDIRAPLPLSMSTLRFGSPQGGFTHAAPIRSLACASCGYIHNFIDMTAARGNNPEPPEPADDEP